MNIELTREVQKTAITVLEGLFGGDTPTEYTTKAGVKVEFNAAKLKHFRAVVDVVEEFINSFDQSQLVNIIDKVSAKQEQVLAGENPEPLNLNDTVKEICGHGSLIVKLVSGSFDRLVKIVPLFCNLSEEDLGELDMDEASIIIFGVFAKNYQFFTQQVLPAILACVGYLQIQNQNPKPQSK